MNRKEKREKKKNGKPCQLVVSLWLGPLRACMGWLSTELVGWKYNWANSVLRPVRAFVRRHLSCPRAAENSPIVDPATRSHPFPIRSIRNPPEAQNPRHLNAQPAATPEPGPKVDASAPNLGEHVLPDFLITQYNSNTNNTSTLTLWTHVRKLYPYEYLRILNRWIIGTDEVTINASLSTETSPTTKSMCCQMMNRCP